jgi:phasin family protein
MNQAPEQVMAMNKASMETALRFAGIALEGTERMLQVQLSAAKNALVESTEQVRALSDVKDPKQLMQMGTALKQPSMEKAASYMKSLYDVAVATQTQMSKLMEEQVAEFSKNMSAGVEQMVKNAPAGSEAAMAAMQNTFTSANSAYDNMTKAAKQMVASTQANVETQTAEVYQAKKKAV